jgi:hypothetical protein
VLPHHCLQAKLSGHSGVRYAAVAAHAAAEGRRHLAALLLDHERCAADQVPLLLQLGAWRQWWWYRGSGGQQRFCKQQ